MKDFFTQESKHFYDKIVTHEFSVYSSINAEQNAIKYSFGDVAHTMIVKNHGVVVTGSSVGEAFSRMYFIDKICRIMMNLMQSGINAQTL